MPTEPKQVCVQLPTSTDNVALPTFACRTPAAADREATGRYLVLSGPTAANPPQMPGEIDRQTDGRKTVS